MMQDKKQSLIIIPKYTNETAQSQKFYNLSVRHKIIHTSVEKLFYE